MPLLYPVMLRLEGRVCVIVGGGRVAAHKVTDLLNAGADVTVISPQLHPTLAALVESKTITAQVTPYRSGMLDALRPLLVFAATDNPAVNRQIADDARRLGALVDAADDQTPRDFMNMATVQRGKITVAVSSGGASPALTVHLQQAIERMIGHEYATLADWMAEARAIVIAGISTQAERAQVWRQVMESTILEQVRRGDEEQARRTFDRIIREALDKPI